MIGTAFGLATQDYLIAIEVALGYLAGESMGWGDWVGQQCGSPLKCGNEGEGNGIKWLASKFYPCGTMQYNKVALITRGIYWWLPALAPLMFVTNPITILLAVLTMAFGFQISLDLARYDGKLKWNDAESIYGRIQGVVILSLIFTVL